MEISLNILLVLALLFFMGSLFGWVLEVFYRRFISAANPERKWINPGFLTGPYLPLYGFSLCALYILAHMEITFIQNIIVSKIVLFLTMAMVVTCIEYIAGIIFIRKMKIKLWDYENEWGNIQGVICPKYSFFWAVLSAVYYFIIHPKILDSIYWLANHLAFSFFMGFFYGIFVIDFWYSMNIMTRIKKFADDNDIIVRYEILKSTIKSKSDEMKEKSSFVFSFVSGKDSLADNLKYYLEKEESRFGKIKKNYDIAKESIKDGYESMKDNIKDGYENMKDNIKENIKNGKEIVRRNGKEDDSDTDSNTKEDSCSTNEGTDGNS